MITPLKEVKVSESVYKLTGSFWEALVLCKFYEYQAEADAVQRYLQTTGESPHWFYKDIKDLRSDLLEPFSENKARRLLQNLERKGFIVARRNPLRPMDSSKQYRVASPNLH